MDKLFWISLIGGLLLFRPSKGKATTTIGPGPGSNNNPNPSLPFMISPIENPRVRNDQAGRGCYLCSRGSRKHHGLDLEADEYQDVKSPIDGIMNRHLVVYRDSKKYTGCEIIGTGRHQGVRVKLFYMVPSNYVNQSIKQGEYIGFMQSINDRYPGQGMLDHIHMEVWINNVRVNPANYIL